MRKPAVEFIIYAAAAAIAFGVDFGLLALLVRTAGWHYLPAAALSFVAGGVVLYVLCIRFVFRFRRIRNPAVELPYFVALGVAGLMVNTFVMFVAVEAAHLHYLLAKLAASACTFVANFLLRRKMLFSVR